MGLRGRERCRSWSPVEVGLELVDDDPREAPGPSPALCPRAGGDGRGVPWLRPPDASSPVSPGWRVAPTVAVTPLCRGPLPSSQSVSRFSSARCVCCLAGAPGSLLPGSHPWPPMASCYQLGVDLKGGPQCRSGDLGPGGGFCPMSQRLGASAPICASGPSPDAGAEGPPTSVGAAWIPNALQKT